MVEIEINLIDSNSIIVDCCEWKTFKESYSEFEELEVLKLWKQSAIEAAQYILEHYKIPESIEIKVKDSIGLYVDTVPAHIGAVMTIGIFDAIGDPLNSDDIKAIDAFITDN